MKDITTGRDILLLRSDGGQVLTVSCDSAGAIGPKAADKIRVSGRILGMFTARVALMETVAVGGRPRCISATLPVERNRTGLNMISGIRREASLLGYEIPILGSTENNFAVRQSGIGVTVIGFAEPDSLRLAKSRSGDLALAVGLPHVGREVLSGYRRRLIADLGDVIRLMRLSGVHDVIPAGSRGIGYEAATLAMDSKLRFIPRKGRVVDLRKSAGPGTVILCSMEPKALGRVTEALQKPLNVVGSFL